MDKLVLKVDDSHRSILVSVELHKRKATVGLHSNLNNVAVALLVSDVNVQPTWKRGIKSACVV